MEDVVKSLWHIKFTRLLILLDRVITDCDIPYTIINEQSSWMINISARVLNNWIKSMISNYFWLAIREHGHKLELFRKFVKFI